MTDDMAAKSRHYRDRRAETAEELAAAGFEVEERMAMFWPGRAVSWREGTVATTDLDDLIASVTEHVVPARPRTYAPLDGSRVDYHPTGRPWEHPTYVDPETGVAVWPEDLFFDYGIHPLFMDGPGPVVVRCGRCGSEWGSLDAAGRYVMHRCRRRR